MVFVCLAKRFDWVPVFLEMPYCLAFGSSSLKQKVLLGQCLNYKYDFLAAEQAPTYLPPAVTCPSIQKCSLLDLGLAQKNLSEWQSCAVCAWRPAGNFAPISDICQLFFWLGLLHTLVFGLLLWLLPLIFVSSWKHLRTPLIKVQFGIFLLIFLIPFLSN